MAVTFFEREPDKISIVDEGRDRGYVFQFFEPGKRDVIGAYSVVVYSPRGQRKQWCAVKFRRVSAEQHEIIAERNLTAHEIVLFEQRLQAFHRAGTH